METIKKEPFLSRHPFILLPVIVVAYFAICIVIGFLGSSGI